jgi:hypothetical protein
MDENITDSAINPTERIKCDYDKTTEKDGSKTITDQPQIHNLAEIVATATWDTFQMRVCKDA